MVALNLRRVPDERKKKTWNCVWQHYNQQHYQCSSALSTQMAIFLNFVVFVSLHMQERVYMLKMICTQTLPIKRHPNCLWIQIKNSSLMSAALVHTLIGRFLWLGAVASGACIHRHSEHLILTLFQHFVTRTNSQHQNAL